MTRNQVLLALSMALLLGTNAIAQTQVAAAVLGQRGGAGAGEAVSIEPVFVAAQGQRSGRGGGPAPGAAIADGRGVRATAPTAWWTDTRLVAQLGLSSDQMLRIERTFEAHRQNLVTNTEALQREEAQLARMLEAESVDRAGVSTQVNRVIQARGDVERTNSAMTLEMREQLTRAQWMQLQSSQSLAAIRVLAPPAPGTQGATPFGVAGGGLGPETGGRGGRGGRGGPAPGAAIAGGVTGGVVGGVALAPPPPEAPMRIGAAVARQNLVSSVNAEYSALARSARVQAAVTLEATISKEGAVTDLKIVSGHPLLNDAAIAAVRQWRYRPQLLNGQPVVVVTTIEVPFNP